MIIKFTEDERQLAYEAFGYLQETLEADIAEHGTLTKWARKAMRKRLLALQAKFEPEKSES